jgi:hypothetical protein
MHLTAIAFVLQDGLEPAENGDKRMFCEAFGVIHVAGGSPDSIFGLPACYGSRITGQYLY